MDGADAQKPQPPLHSLDWQAYRNLSLQPHGFGDERVRIWPKLVNVDDEALLSEHPQDPMESSIWSDAGFDLGDSEKEELDEDRHADEHQIGLDTDRSFVLYPVEGVSSREKLQSALNQLIVSLFRRRPRLHYFQGYHDIVSVVFLTLPKELHLPVVEKLSLHRVRDSMGTNLDPVVGLLRVLKRLLGLVDAQFAEALERAAPLPYYALSYLLTLFSHDVPTLPLIQHIFDYLLCRPPIAVVYLAAALTLTRREEVQALEEEGEDGMVHSLLTMLPDLYEEGDGPPEPLMEHKPSVPKDPPVKHGEPAEMNVPTTALPTPDGPYRADLDGSTYVAAGSLELSRERESSIDASTDGGSETLVDADEPAPTMDATSTVDVDELAQITDGADTPAKPSSPEPKAPTEPSEPPPLTVDEAEKPSPPTPDDEQQPPASFEDEKPMPAIARTPSPSPPPLARPRRPRLSLTALLTQADALMREYPPTHRRVALRSIMGPQSVVHTWAERACDLPPDDDAERMVARPELVVLPPPLPSPLASDDEGWEGDGEKVDERWKKERRKRKGKTLRKPRRLADVIVQRKTMVAGAVLVLGVAVAVYGLNGGLPGVGGGGGHGHGGQRAAWRKMGKMLGGLVGVGERVLDGVREAL